MKTKFLITLGLWLALIVAIIAFEAYMRPAFASSSNTLTANVNVGNVIYLTVANVNAGNVINFGSKFSDAYYDTNVLVTDNDIGGNIGANILVEGSTWLNASTSDTFGVSNTFWSPTSLTNLGTNALTLIFANTPITIAAPSISTPYASNSIYFGVNVPGGTPEGNYIQTISFENYNASQGIYNKSSTANAITAEVSVQGTCYISLSPNSISLGPIVASANVPTNVVVTDNDNGGNVAASLLVAGTNWYLNGNTLSTSFGVSNTLWDASSQSTYNGIALTNSISSSNAITNIIIPAPTPTNTITSNSIYFGLGVPGGTPAGSYEQTITIENSC